VSDLVDALSAPIQFLSQAEMRARQLEGLGIDENDISDVSVPVKQEPLTAVDSAQSPTVPTVTSKQAAPHPTGGNTQPTAGDKEKKGATLRRLKMQNLEIDRPNRSAGKCRGDQGAPGAIVTFCTKVRFSPQLISCL